MVRLSLRLRRLVITIDSPQWRLEADPTDRDTDGRQASVADGVPKIGICVNLAVMKSTEDTSCQGHAGDTSEILEEGHETFQANNRLKSPLPSSTSV